ncbi:hypothetical protein ACI2UK_24325 [Ralstonia nicotianae]|uniref:hypothetical protein n=1 Tax=Ralstonia pseudosolanacearum TaxID=1310165 RepID=UPI0020046018|nr:hypothetical protein [Ralstonia pseudosolanacearum]MCK4120430.1 hypothetical protein [Ralstonia pseudosolanacearum]
MILYPAGPEWARCFVSELPASELAACLVKSHGFTRATFFTPFGPGRGAVIAKRDHMLAMAVQSNDEATVYTVAPSVELQNLLWSFSNGYASQWSERELHALTGCASWQEVLDLAACQFAAAVRSVERAVGGLPEHDPVHLEAGPEELLEIPGDYFNAGVAEGGVACDHSN